MPDGTFLSTLQISTICLIVQYVAFLSTVYAMVSICVFQHAIQLMTTAQQRGGTTFSFRSEMTRMQRGLELSRKDNDFIYHDRIPDIRSLPVIGKAAVAKATLFSTPLSSRFTGERRCACGPNPNRC